MNIPMIDTLCGSIDIKDYNNCISKYLSILEDKKNEAKAIASKCRSDKPTIIINNETFQVLPNGTKNYAYILHNSNYEVNIAQVRSSNEDFYPISIKIKSEYLWSKGHIESWNHILNWVNSSIGLIKGNKIKRLDLCCHTDEIQILENDFDTFKGRFHKDEIFRDMRIPSGMSFGSRKSNTVFCRIYDKTLEINQKNQKLWFKEIWIDKGLNPEKVWNIEFQLDRTFFKENSIESVEEAFKKLKSIWRYCTEEWIVKVDLSRTRKERCPTNSKWKVIQKAFNKFKGESLIKREKQLSSDAFALVPGTIGNITSFAALLGNDDIETVLNRLLTDGEEYLKYKSKSYSEVIQEKMLTKNTIEKGVC
jgi:hypothetical protein